jgi:hypothetical protein
MIMMRRSIGIVLAACIAGAAVLSACGSSSGDDAPPENCSTARESDVDEGPTMRPGGDCIGCHASEGEGPSFTIAGTLMGALNDDTNCDGISGAQVVITDANGTEHVLVTNSAGNFFTEKAVAFPYSAKIVVDGTERAMAAKQSSGACNSCHTAHGANGAPGRISPL